MSDDKKEFWKDYWKIRMERSLTHKWYAIGRMDLLVISISAGGIYVVLKLIEYAIDPNKTGLDVSLKGLKIVGAVFLVSIVSNFISQIFGYNANRQDSIRSKQEMYKVNDLDEFDQGKLSESECWIKVYDKGVSISNFISVGLMIIGLLWLAIIMF
jgi:hypothetical protein